MNARFANRRTPAGRARAVGFTLIELLLSTMLLAAALALAFSTLRAASAAAQRGEITAQHNERMRSVEGFLRRRIASALPIAFDVDTRTGTPLRFVGDEDRIRFVADLPPYLGRGGPHLHEVSVAEGDNGLRLQVAFSVVLSNTVYAEKGERPPELLADGLRSVRIRYRALDAQNRLSEWMDRWEQHDRMPLQVSFEIVDGRGVRWPQMIVALPQTASYSGGFSQAVP